MPWKDKDKYKTAEYKKKQQQWSRNNYEQNKAEVLATTYQRKKDMFDYYQQLKSRLYCIDCGENHPATLQFHHRNPKQKDFTVAEWYKKGITLEKLEAEIEKCDVLCCNCHAKRHFEMMEHKRQRQALGITSDMEALEDLIVITDEEEMAYVTVWTAEHTPGGWINLDPREAELRWLEFQGIDVAWELEELQRERYKTN